MSANGLSDLSPNNHLVRFAVDNPEYPDLVNEADAGIELRITSQPLFDSWHPDQDQTDTAVVEQVAQLLQARDFQSAGLVNQDQPHKG